MLIEELLEEAINEFGGKGLASEMDVAPSEITRFRSNAVGMTMPKINKLLQLCGYTITKKDDREKLLDVVFTMADLAREKRK